MDIKKSRDSKKRKKKDGVVITEGVKEKKKQYGVKT